MSLLIYKKVSKFTPGKTAKLSVLPLNTLTEVAHGKRCQKVTIFDTFFMNTEVAKKCHFLVKLVNLVN